MSLFFGSDAMIYSPEQEGYTLPSSLVFPVGTYHVYIGPDSSHTSDYLLTVKGLSAPRDEKGRTSISGFNALTAIEQTALLKTPLGKYYTAGAQGGSTIKEQNSVG